MTFQLRFQNFDIQIQSTNWEGQLYLVIEVHLWKEVLLLSPGGTNSLPGILVPPTLKFN